MKKKERSQLRGTFSSCRARARLRVSESSRVVSVTDTFTTEPSESFLHNLSCITGSVGRECSSSCRKTSSFKRSAVLAKERTLRKSKNKKNIEKYILAKKTKQKRLYIIILP